jgi:hypothetical protein
MTIKIKQQQQNVNGEEKSVYILYTYSTIFTFIIIETYIGAMVFATGSWHLAILSELESIVEGTNACGLLIIMTPIILSLVYGSTVCVSQAAEAISDVNPYVFRVLQQPNTILTHCGISYV